MKRKHVLLLFLVIGLMGSAAAQSVQVDGLDFEEVNESFDSEGMDFQVYNDSVSLTAKQVFVPDELSDKASFSQYNFVEAPEGDVIQWTGYTFDTGVDYGSPELNDLLAWGEGGGVDAGSKYPANFFNTGAVSEISRGNDTSEVFDTFVVDKNQGYNVSMNVQASSHYEHLVMDYELVYSNESTTEVVAEFQDVYSGEDTEKVTIGGGAEELDSGKAVKNITYDNLYEESEWEVFYFTSPERANITDIDFKGLNHSDIEYNYSNVKSELRDAEVNESSILENVSGMETRAFNVSIPEDSEVTLSAEYEYPFKEEVNNSIRFIDTPDFYSYVIGSGGSVTYDSNTEVCGSIDSYNNVEVESGASLNVCDSSGYVEIVADNSVTVEGSINAEGSGYSGGSDWGDDGSGSGFGEGGSQPFGQPGGAGGAGFGGIGGDGGPNGDNYVREGGGTYGSDSSYAITQGSGGGAGGHSTRDCTDETMGSIFTGGNGGGSIKINSSKINITGYLDIDGENGDGGYTSCSADDSWGASGGGGGSGGSAILLGYDVYMDGGRIYARGGDGGDGDRADFQDASGGGGGGGGRIKMAYENSFTDNGNYYTSGGVGGYCDSDNGEGDYCSSYTNDGEDGESGTFYFTQDTSLGIDSPNQAPDSPTLNSPSDSASGLDNSVTVEVGVSDPDGDTMDVSFYDASDDSQIGSTQTSVSDGGTASVSWSDLDWGTSYNWYAVADDGSATTQSSTWSFTTNYKPNPSFTDDSPVLTNNDLGLDASGSTDQDGDSLTYTWDFNQDGSFTGTGVTPSHSYSDDGTYDITLKADDGLATSTTTNTVTIENRPPSADFSFTKSDKTLDVDGSLSSDQDGSIDSYEWDWTNDGNYEALGSTSSKTFSSGGTYSVELRTTDDDGATDTITENVDINDDPSLDSTSFTSTDVEQGDSTSLEASVSDTDGSVSDVTFTATVGGDTVYSGSSGTDLGGGVFESPSVTADCANCDIEITVDNVTDDDGATVTPGQMGSLTVPNTAPSITNQRFNDTSPDYEDEIVFRTDVSDKEYSVSEVRVTVWENGSKIVDNQTASNTAGSTWEGPSFTVDEVETEYKASTSYAVDSQGLSSDASSEGATDPSISTGNSPPTINDMSFNDSNPDYGEKVRFEADITDSEVGINDSSLQLQVFEGDNKILDTSGSFENGKYVTEGFRPTNIDESYTAEVGFVEDLEGFSTDSSNQGVTVPSISVDAVRPESVNDVNVTGFNSSARSTQVLGENVTTDVDYSIQNSRSYGVDVNLSDEVGQACTLDSNGLGTVSSGSTGEVSEVLNCEVGSTSEAFLDVVTGEPTANYNTVNYSTEITIPSNYTENDDIVWEINDSNLRDWGSREFGTEELIIPSDNSTEVNYVSSSDTVKASILNEESLSEGVYDATLSYYYAQESDSDSGGGGGGTTIIEDDEDDSDNETTIQIEDPNKDFRQRRGLIEPGLEYGYTTEKEFKISNVVPETNQLEVKVPDDGNRFCSYIQVEETLGSDTYSDRGVYNLPSNSDTGTRYANIRYSMPERQVLEAEGVTDYSCSLETSASIGSSDPLDIEAGFDSSALDQLGFSFEGFEVWGKEYCIGGETMEATVNSSQEFSEDGSCSGDTVEGPTGLGAGVIALVLLTSVAAVFYRD